MSGAVASFDFDQLTAQLTVALGGELDAATVDAVYLHVLAQVRELQPHRMRIDLGGVTFFGAAGVRLVHQLRIDVGIDADVACSEEAPARRVLDLFAGELTG